ncbi:MAG: hypothetical protein JWP92_3754 [Caulobacter sp.]|nr:hypothetical protein [Caulobacter sp.]
MKLYAIGAAIIGGLVLVLWLALSAGDRARQGAATAKAGMTIAQGQAGAATDATTVVIDQNTAENASADLTRKNDVEIKSAEGASDKVRAPVDAAGRRALCLRNAYRDQPACKQLLHPGS